MNESQLLWIAIALAGGVVGLIAGRALGRRGPEKERERIQELEAQLASAQAEHEKYRGEVSRHFVETSQRLHDLTVQYKSVYEHLADGARSLCPEGTVAIAASLADAALPENAGERAEDDENQLDLELDLEPLLDEESPPPPKESAAT